MIKLNLKTHVLFNHHQEMRTVRPTKSLIKIYPISLIGIFNFYSLFTTNLI